ncbi:Imm44 family immunity protein [Roseiconus lacunae]|uniref:Imm44 family immunity protein n=1 Tax=Roseiconus lacunae TaxID=2605694 RepID=UPI003092A414|nr:Imm44 family immunity protein [Stieleria sp. HD01]
MKFWMSGECDVKVYDDYRIVRAQIEKDVNRILKSNDYGSGVKKLNVIPIILSKAAQNDLFNEIKRFDRKKRESEFRLHVSLARFRSATLTEKYDLIRDLIIRSIHLMKDFDITDFDFERLSLDVSRLRLQDSE